MTTASFASKVSPTAQAMAAAYARRPQHGEHSGRMQCPKCGSALRFTIFSNCISRGQCAAAGCIRWCN